MERLQKVIAASGYTSRRKAEELIKAGKVYVNGEVVTELGTKVSGNDDIVVNGVHLEKEEYVYFLLNKPRSVICSVSDEHNRVTVTDLISTNKRIYPVGRLDYDTTGVLLLTNDGEFANIMMHPNNKIDKVYIAKIRGIIKGDSINKLKNGVVIDGKKTEKCRVKLRKTDLKTNSSIVEITIHEGRNHQVRKMFESINHDVVKLKREKYANLDLTGVKPGEYRRLTNKEIAILYSLIK